MPVSDVVRALGRRPTRGMRDRAGRGVLTAATGALARELREVLPPDRVLCEPNDLVRLATDASPYRLIPRAIVRPRTVAQVSGLLAWARRSGHGLTFRAAGTSLNGQAQSDDVLVDLADFSREVQVLDGGRRVRTGPGALTGRVNLALWRYGRKLGPDPASSAAASVGGVLANNASGMTCGVAHNAYHTTDSVVIVLASGTVVDTAAPDADRALQRAEPDLCRELMAIRREIARDKPFAQRLRRKFSIKNTSGYRLDAFLDGATPTAILRRLIVGSEGTLGFIAGITWNTVPLGALHTTAFFRFPTLRAAAAAVPRLNEAGAQAVELLDAASIRSVRGVEGIPAWMATLAPDAGDAAVLTELRADAEGDLAAFEARAHAAVDATRTSGEFTRDGDVAAGYWRARSGLLASVGAARPAGTSLITEDVCVPPERLADACEDLEALLIRRGFAGAVNGHASAGNMHFYLYLDATDAAQVRNYRAFMGDLVDLIVDRYDGSLKGEHGTGRNMAPFIRREWGDRAMDFMYRVKRTLDPRGILGPGVFLNEDPDAPFRGLKSMPHVEDALDPCIECGFCEHVCPSRNLTTTPRQRIALQREMARQGWHGAIGRELAAEYRYVGVETCAADSSCALVCPVGIDTGRAMKRVREAALSAAAQRVGRASAAGWGLAAPLARGLVGAAGIARRAVGDRGLARVTGALRSVVSEDVMPGWIEGLPRAAASLPPTGHAGVAAVYFPACVNRIFGQSRRAPEGSLPVPRAVVALAQRAGLPVWIPPGVGADCCATIWQSKGLGAGADLMAARITEDLYRWSGGGRLPIVCDAASCTLGIARQVAGHLDARHRRMHEALDISDVTTWVLRYVAPRLPEHAKVARAVVHPTCSMRALGIEADLRGLASEVADAVVVPPSATCCGAAGDRMMLHPELTESATRDEAREVRAAGANVFLSGNRTCEIGLEHDTGEPYESAVVALERLTRPRGR